MAKKHITLDLAIPSYYPPGFHLALHKWCLQLLYKAASAALQEMARLIPVRSGMAKAALVPSGRLLKQTIEILSRGPRVAADYTRSPLEGKRKSTATIRKRNWKYEWVFQTDVLHFILNELYGIPSNQGIPWAIFEKGYKKFEEIVESELTKHGINTLDVEAFLQTVHIKE